MKNTIVKCKKRESQQGFVLIDVVIAALVMAVGVIAFVNLENVSIKRSQKVNYRLQATHSATSFIELLRSNRSAASWMIANNKDNLIVQSVAPPASECTQGTNGVDIELPNTWCDPKGDKIRNDLFNEVLSAFSNNFQSVPGKAIMCLRSQNVSATPMRIRIVVVWKNSVGNNFTSATVQNCPVNYGDAIPNIDEVDGVESSIGYYEVYTRI